MAVSTRLPMDGDVAMSLDPYLHRGTGVDLSSIACHAAIELGGLMRGWSAGLDALGSLAQILSEKEATGQNGPVSSFLLDPSASVVMNLAIVDARLVDEPLTEDEDLAARTEDISERLTRLVEGAKANQRDDEEIVKMHKFCLALSKRAFATEGSAYENEFHSF